MSKLVLAFLTHAAAVALPPLAAQSGTPGPFRVVGRADAFMTSGYHWRGIRRSAGPLFQLDGAGGFALGPLAATAGIWLTLDPHRGTATHHSDLAAGERGLSEWDVWGQLSWQTQRVTLAGGMLRSQFRRPGKDPRVTEVFGQARLQAGRSSVSLSAWKAVDGAEGLYLEPAASFHHLVWPFAGPAITWATTLRAGIQAGHRQQSLAPPVPGAAGTGLTHVTVSTVARVGIHVANVVAIVGQLSADVQYRRDAAARLRPDGSRGKPLKFWLPMQVGLSVPLRRPGQ